MKLLFFLFFLFFVASCAPQQEVELAGPSEFDDLAKCMDGQGAKMYGSIFCSFCKRQREMFGSSFQYLEEIECDPRGENPQTDLCLQKDIAKTPTWVLEKNGEELDRLEGFQSMKTLAEFSGCSLA